MGGYGPPGLRSGAQTTAVAPTTSTRTKRTGLLAVAVALSAGIHAALVPEHLQEMPRSATPSSPPP
jgi:hypothetical protein